MEASDIVAVLDKFKQLSNENELNPGDFMNVFSILEQKLAGKIPFRYRELFYLLSTRASKSEYKNSKSVEEKKVLVIGGGPG